MLTKGSPINQNDPRARTTGSSPAMVTVGGGGHLLGDLVAQHAGVGGFPRVRLPARPDTVYQLSAEHHYRAEIVLDGVRNWEFLAPQTEQWSATAVNAVSTEFHHSRDILFANYHGYRVTRTIKRWTRGDQAVRLATSTSATFM